ncbi:MAG: hypothetical protein LBN22_11030, partial [Clostridiales Family XIII bacterium]|nr:hypothetical protein [Clostridiales Family XIII bacterium]
QPLDINVSGTLCAIYGEYGAYDDVLSGAGIVPVTVEDGVGNLGEPLAVTDADGNTTVTFAEAGTYILSAIDVTSASKMPLMSPWLVVTVTDDEIAPPVADKTALNKTIARAIKLVESDYTSETWQPFKSALTNAQGIANSDTATQTQVNKAETTLAAAISSLILATDDKGGDSKVKLPPLKDVTKALDSLDAYQTSTAKNPTFGNEWIVLALARNGAISDDYTQKYLENLVTTLKESDGVLSTSKYTEYARVIIALSALGIDAHDVGGYDLLANLYDYDKVVKQGVNGAAYALIALDAASTATKVSTLSVKETQTQSLKNKLIQFILDKQLSDGGWSLGSPKSDPDTTSMVLQALTPYISTDKKIKNTVDKAILTLSGLQNSKTAGYGTCESDAQVMTALNTLKIPLNDVRFAKNGKTLYDDLMTYYIPSQGAFKHTLSGKANGIATEQANYALVSLYRALTGAKPLYDMSDVATYDDTLPSGKDTQPGGKQNPSGGKQGESGSEQNQPNNQNEYNENPNNGNIPNETNSGNEQNSGTTGDTGASSASNLTRVYSNAAGQNRLLSNAEALAGELAKDTVANAANAANAADTADAAETEASIGATSKEKTAARDAIPESQEPKVSGDTTKSDAENGLPIRTVIGIIAGLIAIALIVFLVMQNRKKAKLVK